MEARRKARVSVSLVFLFHGLLGANWLARIPAVQQHLGISVGALGLALLGAPAGALIAMPLTSRLIGRFGSATLTRFSTLAMCAAAPLPALAESSLSLALLLALYGAAAAAMDVAMNTQAVDVERAYGRPVMVSFHALFSFGGMLGSVTGGWAAGSAIPPPAHLAAAGAAIAAMSILAMRRLLPRKVKEPQTNAPSARDLFLPMLGLSAVAFCIVLGEGAMADWGAVYMNRLTSAALAPGGYAVFSLTMALGRLAGDWLHEHLGAAGAVRAGGALAAAGLGLALTLGGLPPALFGFACAGLGFSSIFPIVCSVAGRRSGAQPEAGIAAVAGTGYLGFLVGPPVIGLIAQASSLRAALWFVVALSATAALLAPAVHSKPDAPFETP